MNQDKVQIVLEAISQQHAQIDAAARKIEEITKATEKSTAVSNAAEVAIRRRVDALNALAIQSKRTGELVSRTTKDQLDQARALEAMQRRLTRSMEPPKSRKVDFSGGAGLASNPNDFFRQALAEQNSKSEEIAAKSAGTASKAIERKKKITELAEKATTKNVKAVKDKSLALAKMTDKTKVATGAIQKKEKVTKAAEVATKQSTTSILGFGKAWQIASIAVSAASGLVAGRLYGALKQTDVISTHARLVGTTSDKYQAMRVSAELASKAPGQLAFAVQTLNRQLGEAQVKGSEAQLMFQRVGVATRDAAGNIRDPIEVIKDLADVFKESSGEAAKAQIAQQLFGRSNLEFIDFLNQGSAAMDKNAAIARKLGAIFSSETGARAEELSDRIDRLKLVFLGITNATLAKLMPTLLDLTDVLFKQAVESGVVETVSETLVTIFERMAQTVIITTGVFRILGTILGAYVGTAIENARLAITTLINEFKNLFGIVQTIVKSFSSLGTVFQKGLDFNAAKDEALKSMGDIAKGLLDLGEGAVGILPKVAGTTVQMVQNMKDGAAEAFEDIKKTATQTKELLDNVGKKSPTSFIDIQKDQDQKRPLSVAGGGESDVMKGFEQFQKGLNGMEDKAQLTANVLQGTLGNAIRGISDGIYGLITGTATWGQVFLQVGAQVLQTMIQIGVEMFAQYILRKTLGVALQTQAATEGGSIAASYAPAAATAGAATFGIGTVIGVALTVAAIVAALASLAFADGGIVPGSPSNKDNRIARVATGELILSAASTQAIIAQGGMGAVSSLLSGQLPYGEGFARGGYVPKSKAVAFAAGGLVGAGQSLNGGSNFNLSFAEVKNRQDEVELLSKRATPLIIDKLNRRSNRLKA